MGTYEQRHIATVEMLKELGVPTNILGWEYIVYAVELLDKKPAMIYNVTKELYPAIAKEYDTTSSRVERAIRHAIELAFYNMPADVLFKYFGNSINAAQGKATNSQFISTIAQELRK